MNEIEWIDNDGTLPIPEPGYHLLMELESGAYRGGPDCTNPAHWDWTGNTPSSIKRYAWIRNGEAAWIRHVPDDAVWLRLRHGMSMAVLYRTAPTYAWRDGSKSGMESPQPLSRFGELLFDWTLDAYAVYSQGE